MRADAATVRSMTDSTITWTMVTDVMVSFASPGLITQESYERWIKDFSTKKFSRYLVTTVGIVQLTSIQRKGVADVLRSRKIDVAVVTDEMLVRGLVTAISWMGVSIKAFPWSEMRAAARHLRVSALLEERLVEAVLLLRSAGNLAP